MYCGKFIHRMKGGEPMAKKEIAKKEEKKMPKGKEKC
jgi:hypothetical protein